MYDAEIRIGVKRGYVICLVGLDGLDTHFPAEPAKTVLGWEFFMHPPINSPDHLLSLPLFVSVLTKLA